MSLHEDGVSLSAGRTPVPLQLPSPLPFPASLLSSFLLFPLHLDLVSLSLSSPSTSGNHYKRIKFSGFAGLAVKTRFRQEFVLFSGFFFLFPLPFRQIFTSGMQLLFQQAAPLSSALKVLSWRYSLNITAAIIRLAGAKGKTSSSAVTFFNEKKMSSCGVCLLFSG